MADTRSHWPATRVISRRQPLSFINIVEADKSPAAFGLFKDEANRYVFPVVGSLLERTVNVILPVGLLVRFGACKTLRGVGLAFKNFVITAQKSSLFFTAFTS